MPYGRARNTHTASDIEWITITIILLDSVCCRRAQVQSRRNSPGVTRGVRRSQPAVSGKEVAEDAELKLRMSRVLFDILIVHYYMRRPQIVTRLFLPPAIPERLQVCIQHQWVSDKEQSISHPQSPTVSPDCPPCPPPHGDRDQAHPLSSD